MHGRAGVDIQYRNLCNELFGPMRMFDIEMAAGNMREELHDSHDQPHQEPVGIIENHRKAGEKRRRQKRQKRDRENEKSNRHHDQIRHQRNRSDNIEIPKHQRQRTEPCREGNTGSAAEPFEASVQPTSRTAQQASRQERIGSGPALQKSGKWIGKQYDGPHDCERQLKTRRKKLVRFPAKEKESRRSETIEDENFAFKE